MCLRNLLIGLICSPLFTQGGLTLTPAEIEARAQDATRLRAMIEAAPELPLEQADLVIKLPEGQELGMVSWVARDPKTGVTWLIQRGDKADPVMAFDKEGRVLRSFGKGLYKIPHAIRLDPEGNVWTVDAGSSTVIKFSPKGEKLLQIDVGQPEPARSAFRGATDIAFAPKGRIFISDGYANARILEYTADGKKVREWGSTGTGPGQFHLPHSIEVDENNILYVADRENGRIEKFDPNGKFLGEIPNLGRTYSLKLGANGTLWAGMQQLNEPAGSPGLVVKLDRKTGRILGYLSVTEKAGLHSVEDAGEGQPMMDVGNKVVRFSKTPTSTPGAKANDAVQIEKGRIAATALNDFGLQLITRAAAHKHENLFISPLSVFVALTMAETGSDGRTRAAMRHALSVPADVSEDALHQAASALLKSLNSQQGVELSIANGLWSDPSLPLSPRFVQQSKELYEADARTLNFSAPGAADVINEWVKQKTHDKIPSIVTPDVVRASKAMLTNAVYFRGKWSVPFPKDATQPAPFHLADGREKPAPMMHISSLQGAYRSGDGYEAAVLDYQSSTIKLFAILPTPGKSPEDVLAKLSVKDLLAPSASADLNLSLPRFALDFSYHLKDQLEQMGMGVAFLPGAEFAPMGSPRFFIGDVLHKTRVEVDEEGTVAAAATAIPMMPTAIMRPPKTKTLVFDRPFAILLCDAATGAVLFEGVVYDPAP